MKQKYKEITGFCMSLEVMLGKLPHHYEQMTPETGQKFKILGYVDV